MYVTKQDDLATVAERDRPVIEVTPAMVEAGEKVLDEFVGIASRRELAHAIYIAMTLAKECGLGL